MLLGNNYCMFSSVLVGTKEGEALILFFLSEDLARHCSWSHMCTGSTYTYTPVSFYRKSMAGYIQLALCTNNAPCVSSLGRPSPFCSFFFFEKKIFYSLASLFAGASAEQRAHSQHTGLIHGVHALQKCKFQSMHSGQEKDTEHLKFSPMEYKKPKIKMGLAVPSEVVKEMIMPFYGLSSLRG